MGSDGVDQNVDRSIDHCAREAGNPWAPNNDGFGVDYSQVNPSVAIPACEEALKLERSDVNLYRLARALLKGGNAARSLEVANESAQLGYPPAISYIGSAHIFGLAGTSVDYAISRERLLEALDKGYLPAADNLGYLYSEGLGVTQDLEKASEFYELAADAGYAAAQYHIGRLYLNNTSLGESADTAHDYLLTAAEQDYGPALNQLGVIYEWGRNLAQDLPLALDYYRRGAEADDQISKRNLLRLTKTEAYQSDIVVNNWEAAEETYQTKVKEHQVVIDVVPQWGEPIIESLYLPFYNDSSRLVRARFPDLMQTTVAFYFLADQTQFLYLDGSSDPLYRFNKSNTPYLHTVELIKHYLWFFGYFLRTEPNDMFLVVESVHDRVLAKDRKPETIALLTSKLKPAVCTLEKSGTHSCNVSLINDQRLFHAKFTVAENGSVQMFGNNSIARNGLELYSPITVGEVDHYFDYLASEASLNEIQLTALESYLDVQKANLKQHGSVPESAFAQLDRKYENLRENLSFERVDSKPVRTVLESGVLERSKHKLTIAKARVEIGKNGRNKKAFDMLSSLTPWGYPEVEYELSLFYLFGSYVEPDEPAARATINSFARSGLAEAQNMLGRLHRSGTHGFEKDDAKAHSWFLLAAEQGYAEAQYLVGFQFMQGVGVEQNYDKAFHWFEKGAENNYFDAEYGLATLYNLGRGTEKNTTQAFHWYLKAAESGHVQAAYWAGQFLDFGEGVRENKSEAVRWYRKAANRGHVKAQYRLARKLAAGEGVAKNDVEALSWYTISAESGNADALNSLGVVYLNGRGVPADREKAISFFKQAAEQGHKRALKNLRELGVR